ncbi:MAG: YihA family ribosome biogenesis GTP-binding protein [Clostridia bacterium]|nr:YihA family ribosome biogenesis GTP-binding protein [Clostridia bacterium]
MENISAKFIKSVAKGGEFYSDNRPIIAVSGRSNVGKSSLINMLAGNKKLAKTSQDPGRTRLVNYFDFGSFVLADLPGYGFAKVSKEEKAKWARLLEDFFATQKITLLLSLVDIRHEPTADDKQMINYLYHYSIPFVAVATKADKLPKTKIKPQIMNIAASLKLGIDNMICSSSEKGVGKKEILSAIEQAINAGKEN